MAKNKKLFSEFPPISTETWEEKIHKDLKGADYNRKLVWRTIEGFNVRPYYRSEDLENLAHLNTKPGEFPYTRGTKTDNDWEIRQNIEVENIEEANKKALDILMKGITSLGFVVNKELSEQDFSLLLKDIAVDCVEINFVAGELSHKLIPVYVQFIKKNKIRSAQAKGSFDIDPIGYYSLTAKTYNDDLDTAINKAKESIKTLSAVLPLYKLIAVNAKYVHNAGSSVSQELGYGIAAAADYLERLTEAGLSVDTAAKALKFNFAVGTNYFMEIAKIRAARHIWAKIVNSLKPQDEDSAKAEIHAETSKWNLTAYDPYVNMLRTTTEAMSSTIAGVNSLTVNPFDINYRKTGEFSERIARNQQILLKEESYINKIVDPSAGSYYIETLTASLIEQAWNIILKIDEEGGYFKALEKGIVQTEINEMSQKRDFNIANRKESILGTNQFPNFNEKITEEIDKEKVEKAWKKDKKAKILIPYRGAYAFEELRLKTEKSGKRPKAFMLTYGNLAMRKARATFSCNFFACAGFEVVDNNGFKTVEEGVDAALEAKADIIVLCSSDDEYAEFAIPTFKHIDGKAIFVVAGNPKACIEQLKEAGIQNFIHVRSNVLETLQKVQIELGIK